MRKSSTGKGLRSQRINATAHNTTPRAPPRRRAFHVNSPPDFFHHPIPHMVFAHFPTLPPHQPRCVAAVPSPFFLGSGPHVSQSSVWRVASAAVAAWTVPRATRASAAVVGPVAPVVRRTSTAARASVSRSHAESVRTTRTACRMVMWIAEAALTARKQTHVSTTGPAAIDARTFLVAGWGRWLLHSAAVTESVLRTFTSTTRARHEDVFAARHPQNCKQATARLCR